jgi:hypothetical protein
MLFDTNFKCYKIFHTFITVIFLTETLNKSDHEKA